MAKGKGISKANDNTVLTEIEIPDKGSLLKIEWSMGEKVFHSHYFRDYFHINADEYLEKTKIKEYVNY